MDEAELKKLGEFFEEMGVKPTLTSKDDLEKWMTTYAKEKLPNVKAEQPDKYQVTREKRMEHSRPKIPNFSGKSDRDATPYDVWNYEVKCILADDLYCPELVAETVRRSLKGEAAKVCVRMGPKASTWEVLQKLDGLFGKVATEGTLLTQFYAAKQKEGEDVTGWSCRLEEIIQGVQSQGLISHGTMKEMCRSKLWTGLREDRLREATRYKYDTMKDFDNLVVAIRQVEQESLPEDKVKAKAHIIQKTDEDRNTSQTQTEKTTHELLKQLSTRLERMESSVEELKYQRAPQDQTQSQDRAQGDNRSRNYQGGYRRRNPPRRETNLADIVCYRCGGKGHIARRCEVRTDHLRYLNEESPVQRDEH